MESQYHVGDTIFVKPVQARYITWWPKGVVARVPSMTCVEVDGMPQHMADCCPSQFEFYIEGMEDESKVDEDTASAVHTVLQHSEQVKHLPVHCTDTE